ncbi:MAG TPA: fused MFS/spermidine synthase, partial [Gemmatimonadaceae bacterium]|nr:fused MFS/spermidine synthase [Gemmatimonadaceae bacterium]
VTTFLSTDIAAVPFLWVVPLALYLLTFVLVFARRPLLDRRLVLTLQVPLVLGLMVTMGANPSEHLTALAVWHLATFFVMALACHRELADARPRAEFLTEYYLWMSLGGLLGGVFNVLLAPLLYDRVIEYPFAMIVALALRPMWHTRGDPRRAAAFDVVWPLLVFGAVLLGHRLPLPSGKWGEYAFYAYLGVAALPVATFYRRPVRLALGAAALYVGNDMGLRVGSDTIYEGRSFFGVYRVRQYERFLLLQHGTTTHGGQSLLDSRKTEPLTYYHREGPLGDLFRLVTDSVRPRSVALVGLGTGTTACYARPGERWTYYEIDPLVVSIATHPQLFTYLRRCQPDVRIVMGDARLSLASAPDASFDLITLDAFSSDAIPVHLMTREALRLYVRKLRPGGVVAFHISNRYLDLEPVLVELARDARLAGATANRDVTARQKADLLYGSRWVALATSARALSPLVREAGWSVLPPSARVRVWTDDYSDVWHALRR